MTPSQACQSKPAITALAVAPDRSGFVFGSQAGVIERSWGGDEKPAVVTGLDHVHQLAFSPDGRLLAVAGGTPAEFGAVEIWSWPERKLLRSIEEHDDLVYDCVWIADGKLLATASADRSVRVWAAGTGNETSRLTGHSGPVLALAVSPDGKLLCSSSADQTLRVWDTATWQLVRTLTNHLGPVHSLAFRAPAAAGAEPRPTYLASAGGDGTVRLWQPEIGRLVRIIRHPTAVHCVAWDSAGRLFIATKDGRVREIDAEDGSILREESVSRGSLMSLATAYDPEARRAIIVGDSFGAVHVRPDMTR